MVVSAQRFREFVSTKFKLSYWANRQQDRARQNPQVSASLIFRAMVYQSVLGLGSFLSLDHWLRGASAAALLESAGRRRGSDTTVLKALGAWQWARLREASYALHAFLGAQGWNTRTLSSGRKVKLAVVDGSCFGGMWAVALGFAGKVWQTLELKLTKGRGHELAGARVLLSRVSKHLGVGWATHILYDGLMMVRKDFKRAILQWHCHLVVKTTEETLEIVQSTRAAWEKADEQMLRRSGVEIVRGTDAARSLEYVIYAQAGIRWEGLAFPLKVAWVRQTHLKGQRAGQTEEHWVITTDESLRAEEMREMGQARWAIENHGFKALNAAIGSKKGYLKNNKARAAQILMGSIGKTLLQAFGQWLSQQPNWQGWGIKKTCRWVGQMIEQSANELPGCGSSP